MKEVMDIAQSYKVIIIEDSAQCIGAKYKEKTAGTIANASFYSFNDGKPITTMGGGFIASNDKIIIQKARKIIIEDFKNSGFSQKIKLVTRLFAYNMLRYPYCYKFIYNVIEYRRKNRRDKLKAENGMNIGFKFNDMQASIGLSQLSNLEKFNNARINNANFLREHLNIDGIHMPKTTNYSKPIFLRFPIWIENINKKKRESLINDLQTSGIDAPVAYPNSLPKFFMDLDGFPNTEEIVGKTITLPTHPYVKKNHLVTAVNTIKEFLDENSI